MFIFRNKSQRKNSLLHSKTAPSLLQTSRKETNDGISNENEQNERKNETIRANDEYSERLHNKEGSKHTTSNEYADHGEVGGKKEREVPNRTGTDPEDQGVAGVGYYDTEHRDAGRLGTEQNGQTHHNFEHYDAGHHGTEHGTDHHAYGTDHHAYGTEYKGTEHHGIGQLDIENDDNKYNLEKQLTSENDDGYKDTQVVDSALENIKHSADHSVASSGFESLNQSNTNDIERTETNFGVTMADKENLGIV